MSLSQWERRGDAIISVIRGPERRNWRICQTCNKPGRLALRGEVAPHRPDLANDFVWTCDECDAYVGCHPNTTIPLGRMANAGLRAARQAAHAAFDPLWKRHAVKNKLKPGAARGAGYKWLAEQLGIDPLDCHIAYFDKATCRRVVAICKGGA